MPLDFHNEHNEKREIIRCRVIIRGAVQGVGFRPFVYRLALQLKLPGWVSNTSQGVFIEVEGAKEDLDRFVLRLEKEKPPRSFIQSLEFSFLDAVGYSSFTIRSSDDSGTKSVLVLPDLAACPDCYRDIVDPQNRRYNYPFTNCTNCGPRFSIIENLPYDRPKTTMKSFTMCCECQEEYENPSDRRFHAQPNACPHCGPQLQLWDCEGKILGERHDALLQSANHIRNGEIVAVKGLGGFHLLVDARNERAVQRLRKRKQREEKPFAVMIPSVELVRSLCEVSEYEERLLQSAESPIVLLRKRRGASLASSVAPNNPYLGVLVPYTPLHHLLMNAMGFPVIATSGNSSDEPICIDEHEALERLKGIADFFLIHNRPIVRHVDDSIVRVMLGRELVLRRARGYAPLPIQLNKKIDQPVLSVGAHLKNTVALSIGNQVFLSQHIGDLETPESLDAFRRVSVDLQTLYDTRAESVVCDSHPDYLSTKHAYSHFTTVVEVQHHIAHVASCMAENQIEGEVLGVAWDGTGFGLDGTIWGGEFFVTSDSEFQRIASLWPFVLPGGEKAIKDPRRTAIGVLAELEGERWQQEDQLDSVNTFSPAERSLLQQMMVKGINSPRTSSVGRLFDAVASLLGLRQEVRFEGQAAMDLEFIATDERTDDRYEFTLVEPERLSEKEKKAGLIRLDWRPSLLALIQEKRFGIPIEHIAAKFHATLAEMILQIARKAGKERVILSGGCFQNRVLTERTIRSLQSSGFRAYWHQRVPPNDGGIALGQVYAAHFLKSQSNQVYSQ
ncbi:MAG: carbamoyltransferase HypF [bacterium]